MDKLKWQFSKEIAQYKGFFTLTSSSFTFKLENKSKTRILTAKFNNTNLPSSIQFFFQKIDALANYIHESSSGSLKIKELNLVMTVQYMKNKTKQLELPLSIQEVKETSKNKKVQKKMLQSQSEVASLKREISSQGKEITKLKNQSFQNRKKMNQLEQQFQRNMEVVTKNIKQLQQKQKQQQEGNKSEQQNNNKKIFKFTFIPETDIAYFDTYYTYHQQENILIRKNYDEQIYKVHNTKPLPQSGIFFTHFRIYKMTYELVWFGLITQSKISEAYIGRESQCLSYECSGKFTIEQKETKKHKKLKAGELITLKVNMDKQRVSFYRNKDDLIQRVSFPPSFKNKKLYSFVQMMNEGDCVGIE